MKLRKYTEEQLRTAIKESLSIRGALDKLGVAAAGGNYYIFEKAVEFFKIDTSHFLGMGWLKGKTHDFNVRSLSEILIYGNYEQTSSLKKRLFKDGVKKEQCENCGLIQWLNNPIPLELHHIDGDRKNNVLSNLQILCPNCHSLTDNYRGKKKKKNLKPKPKLYRTRVKKKWLCKECGAEVRKRSVRCKICDRHRKEKIQWPDAESLKNLVLESSYLAVAKELGVSDNAIRKRIKNHSAPMM